MIHKITIKNFKCFENETISLSNLTVLAGINGMGKSSLIQTILLLRQSLKDVTPTKLMLNGPLINLGYSDDILFENATGQAPISFEIAHSAGMFKVECPHAKGEQVLDISELNGTPASLLSENFYYLKAERVGPRTSFPISSTADAQFNKIGNAGEFCAFILASNERKQISNKQLCHESNPINELREQVEAWLSEIGQTPRIHLDKLSSLDSVSMQFSFMRNGIPSSNYRTTNVGFGLTYSLPIFVSCLAAQANSIILIENPEAHLHPKGQVAMGKFLAMVASTGIQIILETHSDHVLNGIRIAAKQNVIKPNEVALNFFQRVNSAQATEVVNPKLDRNGRLDIWPEGFFDEWEKGLAELL